MFVYYVCVHVCGYEVKICEQYYVASVYIHTSTYMYMLILLVTLEGKYGM